MARHGGYVKRVDLASVRIRELEPVRTRYRGAEILSFPSPGGGQEVVEALNILETFPSSFLATDSIERLQVMADAHRIAQFDRLRTDSGRVGWSPTGPPQLSKEFATQRASLITPGRALPAEELAPPSRDPTVGEQTTQVTVVDRHGNSVSLTQTLCKIYGNATATPGLGFPYSACLEYLDYENPQSPTFLRPRATFPTSMAPTIVREGQFFRMALGGPGSDRVPATVTTVISNVVDRQMGIRDAVAAPRTFWNSAHDPPRFCLEIAGSITSHDAAILREFGYNDMYVLRYSNASVGQFAFFGAVNAVAYDSRTGEFTGVADPRRAGFAVGPRVAAESVQPLRAP
jgi:gamma-glutamyltranspeptidase/glutathione hydrolase